MGNGVRSTPLCVRWLVWSTRGRCSLWVVALSPGSPARFGGSPWCWPGTWTSTARRQQSASCSVSPSGTGWCRWAPGRTRPDSGPGRASSFRLRRRCTRWCPQSSAASGRGRCPEHLAHHKCLPWGGTSCGVHHGSRCMVWGWGWGPGLQANCSCRWCCRCCYDTTCARCMLHSGCQQRCSPSPWRWPVQSTGSVEGRWVWARACQGPWLRPDPWQLACYSYAASWSPNEKEGWNQTQNCCSMAERRERSGWRICSCWGSPPGWTGRSWTLWWKPRRRTETPAPESLCCWLLLHCEPAPSVSNTHHHPNNQSQKVFCLYIVVCCEWCNKAVMSVDVTALSV